jgi:DNA-binding response OmpR family regulator
MEMLNIVFVSDIEGDSYWYQVLSESLTGYGPVIQINEQDIDITNEFSHSMRLVILDAGNVDNLLGDIAKIRANSPNSKILVVSASPTWKESREVIYAGANDYCKKFLNNKDILEHIKGLIGSPGKKG